MFSTGNVISGAMLDANNNLADYAIIPAVFDGTFGAEVYDVDDIAYNPYKGKLYAIQNQDGPGTITELDPVTGEIIEIVYDTWKDGTEGLGFDYLGELYASGGDNGSTCTFCKQNMFIYLNIEEGITTELHYIDSTLQEVDFEAFDCFTAYNDLALKVEVDPNSQQPIRVGQTVSFIITIYNQGDFRNSDITLTNYLPNGMGLADNNWTNTSNGKAIYTIPDVLEAGDIATVSITFLVDQGLDGQTITNATEISASYSPDIIDVQGNRYTKPLPDLDSQPDDQNNETNVSNNEVNGGGLNAIQNKDEDDHDIAIIQVQQALCPAYLVLPDEEISGYYQAQQEIEIKGYVEKPKTAVFKICE